MFTPNPTMALGPQRAHGRCVLAENMKAVDDGGNPPASPGSNAIEQDGVENPDPHDFANDGCGKRLEIGFFDGQKSEAPSHFDASKQEEKPLRRTQELCDPTVLEAFIFVENA